jgi:LysR family nitrogen assimilation transcriptional regulator
VDLRQLVYFKAVAEGGSFARASVQLRIAQPAISSQVSSLENELGSRLFTRHARGVTLTEAGVTLLEHAGTILQRVELARAAVRELSEEPIGILTIGMPTTIANVLGAPLVVAVRDLCPKLELQLVEALSGEINTWHAAGRFDLAVLYSPDGKCLPKAVPLLEEQLYLLGPAVSSQLHGAPIKFHELARYPLYHTSRIHACRLLLDDTAAQLGVNLNYVAEIDSIALLHEFVVQKNAFTIFPCVSTPPSFQRKVQYRRIVEPDLCLKSFVAPGFNRPNTKGRAAVQKILPTLVTGMLADGTWPGASILEPA